MQKSKDETYKMGMKSRHCPMHVSAHNDNDSNNTLPCHAGIDITEERLMELATVAARKAVGEFLPLLHQAYIDILTSDTLLGHTGVVFTEERLMELATAAASKAIGKLLPLLPCAYTDISKVDLLARLSLNGQANTNRWR
jgi:hypothetical protein